MRLAMPTSDAPNAVNMLPTGVVIIGHEDNIGTAKKFRVFWFPLLRATTVASARDAPRRQQVRFRFALDNENGTIGGDRLN